MTREKLQAAMAASIEDRTTSDPMAKASNMLQTVLEALREGVDADLVTQCVDSVWESTVVPYDIPWIPEFIEKRLEKQALAAIHDAIDAFFDQEELAGE